jgi:hypothetical protein
MESASKWTKRGARPMSSLRQDEPRHLSGVTTSVYLGGLESGASIKINVYLLQ